MLAKKILRVVLIILLVGSNIGCDQISKNVVRENIEYNELIYVNNYLTLTKVENAGAFLSIGNSLPQPVKIVLLIVFPILVLGIILVYLLIRRDLSKLKIIGICFIVGGGIGNIYDRVLYGSATDFLHIDFVLFQTGIFNMADISVMTGVIMVLFETFFIRRKAELSTNNY